MLSPCLGEEEEEDEEEDEATAVAAAAKVFHSRMDEDSGTLWHQVWMSLFFGGIFWLQVQTLEAQRAKN